MKVLVKKGIQQPSSDESSHTSFPIAQKTTPSSDQMDLYYGLHKYENPQYAINYIVP